MKLEMTPDEFCQLHDALAAHVLDEGWSTGRVVYDTVTALAAVKGWDFVRAIPTGTSVEIVVPAWRLVQDEMEEHGSVALRLFTGEPGWDNTIDETWTLTVGGTVLVRSRVGFFMVDLQKNEAGWFVRCGEEDIPVVFSEKRKRWVIERIPGCS